MTKVYKERYGFTEEQLQYLVLTVRLEQLQNVEEFWTVTTSQIMWLYNRKGTGKIFPIGYPDDYEVSDSETECYEHLDTYPDQTNDVHYVRAVYVIWPEALEDVYLWTNEGQEGILSGGKVYHNVSFGWSDYDTPSDFRLVWLQFPVTITPAGTDRDVCCIRIDWY